MPAVQEDEPELDDCIEEVLKGTTKIDLPDIGFSDASFARLTAAVLKQDHPVKWKYDFAYQNEDQKDHFEIRKVAADEDADDAVEYGGITSELPHVESITIKLNMYGRTAIVGLTSDPEDDHEFANGFGLRLASSLSLASGFPIEDNELVPIDDLICIAIKRDEDNLLAPYKVEAYRNGKMIEVLGVVPVSPTGYGAVGLYAKVYAKESDVKVRIVETITTSKVETVQLRGNRLADKGATSMAEVLEKHNTLITSLDVSSCRIGDVGVMRLAEALERCGCKVTTLNLRHNRIEDKGAARLAEALENEHCLITDVDLTDNDIGDEGALRLAQALDTETCIVTTIKLAINRIESTGVVSLAEVLEKDTCKVTHVQLGSNKPSKMAKQRLAKAYASQARLNVYGDEAPLAYGSEAFRGS